MFFQKEAVVEYVVCLTSRRAAKIFLPMLLLEVVVAS